MPGFRCIISAYHNTAYSFTFLSCLLVKLLPPARQVQPPAQTCRKESACKSGVQVSRVDAVLVERLCSGVATERSFRNPEPDKRLLKRPDYPTGSEQPHPQVDVLVAPRPLGVAEFAQDFRPHHHRRMGKWRSPVQRCGALRREFWIQPDFAEFHSIRARIGFLDATSEDVQSIVRRELRGLLLKPTWQTDVVLIGKKNVFCKA